MSDVLERNLEALLQRYEPVRPTQAFRSRTQAALERAVAPSLEGHSMPRWFMLNGSKPNWRVAGLAAAAALILGVSLALLLRPGQDPSPSSAWTLDTLLAQGRVAVRELGGDWSPGQADDVAPELLALEVATPAGQSARLTVDGGTLQLSPDSRASFQRYPEQPLGGTLAKGELRSDVPVELSSDAAVILTRGSARFALRDPRLVARAFERPVERSRPLLEVELEDDGRWLPPTGEALELEAGLHHFQLGRHLRPLITTAGGDRRAAGAEEEPIDQQTHPRALLTGRVHDFDGRALEEFQVWVLAERAVPDVAFPVAHPQQQAGGAFTLSLTPDTYTVLVDAPGYAVWKTRRVQVEAGEGASLDVTLSAPGTVSGHVVDRETGAPIAGALVLAELDLPCQVVDLTGSDLTGQLSSSARTDSAGRYELSSLSYGRHHLRISAAGYGPSWTPIFELAAPALGEPLPKLTLDLTELGHGGVVQGRVEDARGLPWVGAQVILSHIVLDRPQAVMTYGGAVTDGEGNYRLEGMPPGPYVGLTISADGAPGLVRQGWMVAGEVEQLDFKARPDQTKVTGRLLDVEGEPLADHHVSLTHNPSAGGFEDWVATTTDDEGEFEFPAIEPGTYGLMVSQQLESMARLEVVEIPAAVEHRIDLVLPRTGLVGTVSVPPGEDPTRVELVLMRSVDGTREFHGRCLPDSAGRYQFAGIEPGEYLLSVLGLDTPLGSLIDGPFEVVRDQVLTRPVQVEPGGKVRLLVRDVRGERLAVDEVSLRDAEGRWLMFTSLPQERDPNLVALPALGPGRWTVTVTAEGYAPLERQVLVVSGEERLLELELDH